MVQNFSITRFSVYQKDSKKILNQQNFGCQQDFNYVDHIERLGSDVRILRIEIETLSTCALVRCKAPLHNSIKYLLFVIICYYSIVLQESQINT